MSPIIGSKSGLAASAYGFTANTKSIVTGGTLYSDATYYYRAFTGSGTLTISALDLSADVLVIAGGGGGYVSGLGPGGAGGYRYFSGLVLAPSSYSCTVGGGGVGETGYAVMNNTRGANSTFQGGAYSYSSTGGGTAGNSTTQAGGSGSSNNGVGNQGGYTPPEGYYGKQFVSGGAGGPGTNTGLYGGAGPGSSAQSAWGAATGLGENVSGTYYFAGGGGNGMDTYQGISLGAPGPGQFGSGGAGLAGGRGATVNSWYAAGNGQNGAVIIRYLKSAV